MPLSWAIFASFLLAAAGYIIGRSRAFASAGPDVRKLHSRPTYHGYSVALTALLPALAKELAEHRPALLGQHATFDQYPVVEKALIEELTTTDNHAGLRLGGTIDDSLNARMHDQPGAHAARLERHVERTTG